MLGVGTWELARGGEPVQGSCVEVDDAVAAASARGAVRLRSRRFGHRIRHGCRDERAAEPAHAAGRSVAAWPTLSRPPLALCALGVVVVVALGVQPASAGGGDGAGAAPAEAEAPIAVAGGRAAGGGRVVVHVAGAVRRPGRLPAAGERARGRRGARAGGATRRADLGGLNLAAKVEDGRQVLVPERARRAAGARAGRGAAAAARRRTAAPGSR